MSESLHNFTTRWRQRTVEVPVLRVEEVAACCAVLGHVAKRSGAVFISDPGPSMKKKSPSGKRAGDAQRGPALQAEIQDCWPF